MAEITYFPELRCRVSEGLGLRDSDVTIEVVDEHGRSQFLHAEGHLVHRKGGQPYLPVGIVELDRPGRRALVELPVEADSGANRLWVNFDDLRHESQVPA